MADKHTELMEKHWPTLKSAINRAQEKKPRLDRMVGVTTTDDPRPFRIVSFSWSPPDGELQRADAEMLWARRIRIQKEIKFDELLVDPASVRDRLERWAKDHNDDERDVVFDLVAQSVQSPDHVVPYRFDAIQDRLGTAPDPYRLVGPKHDEATAKGLLAAGLVKEVEEFKTLQRDHYLLIRIRGGPSIVRMTQEESPTWIRRGDQAAIQIAAVFFLEEGEGSMKLVKT